MGSVPKNVKGSVDYVCGLLASLGIAGLTPEIMRQAKFNSSAVAECLLRAMHDLVILQLSQFPSKVPVPVAPAVALAPASGTGRKKPSSQSKGPGPGSRSGAGDGSSGVVRETEVKAARAVLDELWRTVGSQDGPPDEALAFVKFYLAVWGFPPHSPIFTLSFPAQESRHLLLALGWLVSHCQALERGFQVRIEPLLAARALAPLPAYPPDVGFTPEARAKGEEANARAEEHVARVLASLNGVTDVCKRADARAHQALMLYGKVQAKFKSLYSLRCCKARRMHELNLAQIEAGIENTDMRLFSQYELYLLQNKEALELHIGALEAEKKISEEVQEYERHEELFWEWMESVVLEARKEESLQQQDHGDGNGSEAGIDVRGVSPQEMEPLIQFLQQELGAQEGGGHTQSVSVPEGIHLLPPDIAQRLKEIIESRPPDEDAADKLVSEDGHDLSRVASLGLAEMPSFVYNPGKMQGRSDSRDPGQCIAASDKIEGLTNLAVTLARVLARVRARNRAVIQDILHPLMEDDNYLIVGL